jgi:hypothetical protein
MLAYGRDELPLIRNGPDDPTVPAPERAGSRPYRMAALQARQRSREPESTRSLRAANPGAGS